MTDPDSRLGFECPWAGDLFFGDTANVFRGSYNGAQKFGTDAPLRRAYFLPGNPNAVAREIQIVQFFRPGEKSGIAAFAHIGNDFGSDGMGFLIALRTAREQPLLDSRCEPENAHHSTILFKGYSTIPCALAAFSFGRICRTTASSMMVFIATQSGSLKVEIVGFLSAGRTPRTACRSSRWTFKSKPTLLAAAMAPCSIRIRLSAFSRFQESADAARFMMNTISECITRMKKWYVGRGTRGTVIRAATRAGGE